MLRRRLIPAVLAAALVASLAAATDAQASSIVFIKRGDVWLAKADGSGQRALTRNGTPGNPYRSPSYSNKGVITAVKGRRNIHFFDRRGKQLRKPRDLTGGPTPPYDAVIIDHAISPDGRTLASTIWLTTRSANPRPGEPTGTDYQTSVWYSRTANGQLRGRTDDGQAPAWLSGSRLLVFAPYVYHSADVYFARTGTNNFTPWFQDRTFVDPLDPSDGAPLTDGELSRAQDKLGLVRGPNTPASSDPTMIRVYAVSSLSARPSERCDLRQAGGVRYESPSWSPDGNRLVWSERSGIWVTPIAGGTGDCAAAPRLLIRGGSEPDWGPANVPRRKRRR